MNDDAPRCPNCGKRVSVDVSACPACGYELLARRPRIRCSRCGSRIPADSAVCPHCGANPRASRFPLVARVGAIVLVLLLCVCIGWVIFRAITTNMLSRALGLGEPSRVPTQVINIIYVVATPAPPTPTLTPNPTVTPARKVSPTPTRRGARTPTGAPPTAGPPRVQGLYAAPQLIAPLNATVYDESTNPIITLQWQPVSPNGLSENEWYYITISFTARDGSPGLRTGWSKETHWDVPNAWWSDAASDARAFKWNVSVMRIEGADPTTSPSKTLASPNSATRTFFWN